MDTIGPGQIELRIHGLVTEDHGRVPARVFANKLKQFVMALEAADAYANGRLAHTYLLTSMHMSQPAAVVSEVLLNANDPGAIPALPTFRRAIDEIKSAKKETDLKSVIVKLNLLASGAESKFGFAEIRDDSPEVIRIDGFLKSRAYMARWEKPETWFSGISYSSYDGYLKYVDTRGELPQIKLQLSAGGKEIDCVCRREDIQMLGTAIEKRVRIYGKAIHDGGHPLPVRVEISSIEPVGDPSDFSQWNGSFRPFEPAVWDGIDAESTS